MTVPSSMEEYWEELIQRIGIRLFKMYVTWKVRSRFSKKRQKMSQGGAPAVKKVMPLTQINFVHIFSET